MSVGPDLGCRASVDDPAGYFAQFREAGPVQWSDTHSAWVVIGHAAAADAFRDATSLSADRIGALERAAANQPEGFAAVVDLLRGWMIFRDPPAQTRLREPVRTAFTPRRVAGLEPAIETIVGDVLDELSSRDGPVDLTKEIARPIPALVIAELLGVDAADRQRFQAWSDALALVVFSTTPGARTGDAAVRAAEDFSTFFGELVARERAAPTGGLVTAIAAMDSSDLSDAELVGLCTLLLFAGHETTTTLLSNAMAILCEQPELRDRLRAEPALWPTAVDELMRTRGSARTMVRKVAADHERSGAALQARQNVFISIAAANHDPEVFDRPEHFTIARDPNPHLGFGWGLHHCLGANLARVEAQIALRMLVERFATIEPAAPVPPLAGAMLGFGPRPLLVHLRT